MLTEGVTTLELRDANASSTKISDFTEDEFANPHNGKWGNSETNPRGDKQLYCILSANLMVCNQGGKKPFFQTSPVGIVLFFRVFHFLSILEHILH